MTAIESRIVEATTEYRRVVAERDAVVEQYRQYREYQTRHRVDYHKAIASVAGLEMANGRVSDEDAVYLERDWTGGDKGLVHLQGLPKLKRLCIRQTPITNDGMDYITGLESLVELHLDHTAVTIAGLARLPECENLMLLTLGGPEVDDAWLDELPRFPRLRFVRFRQTRVTDDGLNRLKAILPQLEFHKS